MFAALLLSSSPAQAAHFCLEPSFARGAAQAEMIFSGKIAKIERVQTHPRAIGDYVVTFKVERWWKGTAASEPRVLWRTAILDCALPIGEVGDDYLVYADPAAILNPAYQLPEVSFYNRTSRLPPSRKAEMIVKNGFSPTVVRQEPPLNRADASNDVDLLLTIRECGCLRIPASSAPIEASAEETQRVSECQACLRRTLKPSW